MENCNSSGSKYDRDLSIVAIAKRVRAEIKASIKSGAMPDCKISVRVRKYSGGRSLDVEVTAAPEGFVICSPERVLYERDYPHSTSHPGGRYTDAARALLDALEGIRDAYNYDRSDRMTDYFDVNFYGSVSFDWELERDDKARTLASFEAPVAAPPVRLLHAPRQAAVLRLVPAQAPDPEVEAIDRLLAFIER